MWSHGLDDRRCGWCGGWHRGPCGIVGNVDRDRGPEEVKKRGRSSSVEAVEGKPGVVGQLDFDLDGLGEGLAGKKAGS